MPAPLVTPSKGAGSLIYCNSLSNRDNKGDFFSNIIAFPPRISYKHTREVAFVIV